MQLFVRSSALILVAAALLVAMAADASAQAVVKPPASTPKSGPADTTGRFVMPEGDPLPGHGRRVVITGKDGKEAVARIVVEVGDKILVNLPDGSIQSLRKSDGTATQRPFEPASKEALLANLTKEQFKGFKSKSTKRFIYIYNCSEPFAKATSTILETMYPGVYAYCKQLEIPLNDPEYPLVVIMFKTEKEYLAFNPRIRGAAAYYSTIANHVVMYEQDELAEIEPELAVKQSISVISHEGCHQILANIGVQNRLAVWPMWMQEGIAEFFAPTSMGQGLRWKGAGVPNDFDLYGLSEFMKAVQPQPGTSMRQTVEAQRLTSTGYAAAWGLTHFLAQRRRPKFIALLKDLAQLGPMEHLGSTTLADGGARNREHFEKYFGSDYPALEGEMIKHLQSLPYVDPIENQTHYVAGVLLNGTMVTIITTSPAEVKEWQQRKLQQMPADLRGQAKFDVRAFPNHSAAETFRSRL